MTSGAAAGASSTRPPLRVSVAIPTFNRAHLVTRAIRSALAQTIQDIEILVVDDGSTDATPEVLARIEDPRLQLARHERNAGISRTRNTAIRLARGEWMAFLDDDNEWAPEYLERQLVSVREHPGAGVVYCRARRRDARTSHERIMPAEVFEGKVLRHLLTRWNPLISCALVRRSLLVEIGGLDERLGATEDHDLWLRLAQRTDFAATADVLVVRHVGHGDQLSTNFELRTRDAALLDAKWRATLTRACGRPAYRRWRLEMSESVERARERQRARAGRARPRRDALRRAARLARFLPESAPALARALAAALLGPGAWTRAKRRLAARRRGTRPVQPRPSG